MNLSGKYYFQTMKNMRYKGYAANIGYSDVDGCFIGHIATIHDIVGFHTENWNTLYMAFKDAVTDYLDL